ncbi:MAG TPA: ABC transporter permease [Symbiobacteriaceae bacterium]|jgi:peptide/nickel transport system permease protein
MRRYVLGRLLQVIPMVLGVTLISFVIIKLAPGGFMTVMADNPDVDPALVDRVRVMYGLDRPVMIQYLVWLGRLLTGNFGESFVEARPVMAIYLQWLPNTLLLNVLGMCCIFLLAIPIGIIAAVKQYSRFDFVVTAITFASEALPSFVLAMVLIYAVALPSHGAIPLGGIATYGVRLGNAGLTAVLLDRARHLVLPLTVVVFGGLTGLTRYVRSSMLEVIREDFVRTARAKGLPERVVIYRHALRNAIIPIITVVGQMIPAMMGGSVVVEQVFGWPGIGLMTLRAVLQRDYPVIMASLTVGAVLTIVTYLVVDVLYVVVDPRIKYS